MVPSSVASVSSAYSSPDSRVIDRMAAFDAQVDALNRMTLAHERSVLDVNAFHDVTDEKWSGIERWYDGAELVRLRMLPGSDRQDTHSSLEP